MLDHVQAGHLIRIDIKLQNKDRGLLHWKCKKKALHIDVSSQLNQLSQVRALNGLVTPCGNT